MGITKDRIDAAFEFTLAALVVFLTAFAVGYVDMALPLKIAFLIFGSWSAFFLVVLGCRMWVGK